MCREARPAAAGRTARQFRADGGTPILMPKSDSATSGTGADADMLRSLGGHPGAFHKKFAMRNNAESTLASMKKRLGGIIRAKRHLASPGCCPCQSATT